jgi:hypothetical protein
MRIRDAAALTIPFVILYIVCKPTQSAENLLVYRDDEDSNHIRSEALKEAEQFTRRFWSIDKVPRVASETFPCRYQT